MGGDDAERVTVLLDAAASGDRRAADELLPLVYDQLRRLAQRHMGAERPDHTLQATALVHEAYARLVGPGDPGWGGRGHFYKAAAEAIRRILVEHARARGRVKRGGDRERAAVSLADVGDAENPDRILSIDAAFRRLEDRAPEMADVVRLRFFGGLDVETTAMALGISRATATRRWTWARASLFRDLEQGDRDDR